MLVLASFRVQGTADARLATVSEALEALIAAGASHWGLQESDSKINSTATAELQIDRLAAEALQHAGLVLFGDDGWYGSVYDFGDGIDVLLSLEEVDKLEGRLRQISVVQVSREIAEGRPTPVW